MTVVCPRPSGDPDTLLRLLASGAGEQVAGRDTWLTSRTWGDNWQVQQYSIL